MYTEIESDCPKASLEGIMRGWIVVDSVIHSYGWRGYDELVDTGIDKHYRVHLSKNEFVNGERYIYGIQSF